MASSDDHASSTSSLSRPTRAIGTVKKSGRTYLSRSDVSVPYPLPVDLAETHRQIMFAQLTSLVYDTPILSRDLLNKPPLRVLELGCDTGWWSATCHQYFQARGYDIEFVGMDIKPPAGGIDDGYRHLGTDFSWEYVQHDLNQYPWPFPDGYFDLVMARNIALALNGRHYSETVQEYVRVLRPGGTLELWEHDTTLRALRPEVRHYQQKHQQHQPPPSPLSSSPSPSSSSSSDLTLLGVYPVADSAAFRAAVNPHAAQYNTWVTAGLADVELPTMPCSYLDAMFRGHLVGGSEDLNTESMLVKRLAIPLSVAPIIWERDQQKRGQGEALGPDQEVIRRTALENFVAMVEAFGPLLQAKSGMGQADWDVWLGKAKKDWLEGGGFAYGECMELGVWSLKKHMRED